MEQADGNGGEASEWWSGTQPTAQRSGAGLDGEQRDSVWGLEGREVVRTAGSGASRVKRVVGTGAGRGWAGCWEGRSTGLGGERKSPTLGGAGHEMRNGKGRGVAGRGRGRGRGGAGADRGGARDAQLSYSGWRAPCPSHPPSCAAGGG